jgi:hypothetical protein
VKYSSALALLGLIVFTSLGFWFAPLAREPWIIISFLGFFGIYLFDGEKNITKNFANTSLFLITYGLLIKSILEGEPEYFWRDCAGIIFLIALSFEQNSPSWFGTGGLKSSVGPAVLFYIFILASSLPILNAEQTLICTTLALLIFCFLEVFYILRAKAEGYAGSFMSAIRASACGTISLYYCSTFLPGISANKPFTYVQIIFPIIGLLMAIFAAFFEEKKKSYIIFCAGWSLFIFWAALSTDPLKVYAAVGASVIGSWTIMMTNGPTPHPKMAREIFLKLSAWGIPGTALFSFIVFTLLHSENDLARMGSVIWLSSFLIYWWGVFKIEWADSEKISGPWTWRNSLALSITIAGGGLLAGAKIFPTLIRSLLEWVK